MSDERSDQPALDHIQRLASEEEQIYARGDVSDADRDRLAATKVELDRCWDLLRQRRARREYGQDPNEARLRSADVVEKYQG
jgi:Protein of unknown function (DUF2630)